LLVSLADALSDRDQHTRNDVEHLSRALVRDRLGAAVADAAAGDRGRWVDALWATLARYGGDRSASPTLVEETYISTRRVSAARTRRSSALARQQEILTRAPEEVLAELAAQAEREGDAPFIGTYACELLMWLGRADEAFARLDALWQTTRTRWSYIGSGAALSQLGRLDEARARWAEGERHFHGLLAAEATYAYRGDVWRELGEYERARADLVQALRTRPTRVGARVSLALTYARLGATESLHATLAELSAQAPGLLWEAHKNAGLGARIDPQAGATVQVLKSALTLLRGNRSSVVLSYYAADGSFRVHAAGRGRVWNEFARHHQRALRDGLLELRAPHVLAADDAG
jgi:tetratricopeptide (TPR) repeat protein